MKPGRKAGLCLLLGSLLAAQTVFAVDGNPNRGREIYNQRCIICHGPDGGGNDGMAADFRREWHRLTKPDAELINNIRNGLRTPGKRYKAGPMPPQGMSERDIRDVLAYLRENFLN